MHGYYPAVGCQNDLNRAELGAERRVVQVNIFTITTRRWAVRGEYVRIIAQIRVVLVKIFTYTTQR